MAMSFDGGTSRRVGGCAAHAFKRCVRNQSRSVGGCAAHAFKRCVRNPVCETSSFR
jgi:hypothetical protein